MNKQIRIQSVRIGILYCLLGGLVTWQWHFVHTGINSNPYLNWGIIGVFLFGTFLAVRSMLMLRDEAQALAALKEVYADVQSDRAGDDPLMRHERCFTPGIVFSRPRILGHVFELTLDELLRTRHMRISIATMQNLLQAIDVKAAHDRALLHYITGLLVFLGLIGTFIGLMEMVASVGGIIGSLANTDNGSSDAVKRLIHDLEAPLVGMATGFSSSLFGLFTSLVLGLVLRFTATATHSVKEEFEAWLANVSQLETESGQPGAATTAGSAGVQIAPSISPSTATALLGAIRRSNQGLDRTAELLRSMIDRQADQIEAMRLTSERLERVAAQQGAANLELAKLDLIRTDVEQARADVFRVSNGIAARLDETAQKLSRAIGEAAAAGEQRGSAIAAARTELSELMRGLDHRLAETSESILRSATASHRDQMTSLRSLTGEAVSLRSVVAAAEQRLSDAAQRSIAAAEAGTKQAAEAAAILVSGQDAIHAQIKSIATEPAEQLAVVARGFEARLSTEFGDIGRVLDGIARMLSDSLSQIAAQQLQTAQAVGALTQSAPMLREIQELRRTLDEGIASGLGNIAGAVEAAFRTYGEIADRAGLPIQETEAEPLDEDSDARELQQKLQAYANQRWAGRQAR
jgi:hypothetical protein